MNPKSFKCPECGSNEFSGYILIDCQFTEGDIWSAILQRYKCAKCARIIPAHLAERWDDRTDEQASQQWHQRYRATAPTSLED